MRKRIGVCLGASTVSLVKAEKSGSDLITITDKSRTAHNGDPKGMLLRKLKEFNPEGLPVIVTGRKFRSLVSLETVSEPEATEYALEYIKSSGEEYDAVASLGGETFMIYTLDTGMKISNVIAKNQCASGTGEFFLQQIKRMGLGIQEAIDLASGAKPFMVSGRCSVFCKSDCTHALNKGTPKAEVTAGLAEMISDKIGELLGKVKGERFLLTGGVTLNTVVMDFVRKSFPGAQIPEVAPYFEALGAAVYGLGKDLEGIDDFDNIFVEKASSFVFHEPLKEFAAKVTFESVDSGTANDGDECILGLDVGSTTTKAVLVRRNDNAILGKIYLYTNGDPVGASRKCYEALDGQIDANIKIIGLGVTGSGRQIAGLHALTEGITNEIIAHATAAVHFDPEVDTIFEIGGQDAKYTYIVNKVPADYAMNEACSAGTGSFIEEAAYESLGIDVREIEPIAMRGAKPPNFSDQCAAFIGSDIKTAQQENIPKEDIVAGLVYSICLNYVNRVKGERPVGKKVFMQGGVCYNKAIPVAMAALSGREIIVPPEPGLMGAFGVALDVKEKIALGFVEEKVFSLYDLARREVKYLKPFVCAGGREKCDLACTINMIEINGEKYPFGGACDKYYNVRHKRNIDVRDYDFISIRHSLMFGKYAPVAKLPENAPTVGLNLSFHTYTLYPLYYNFFSKLGFRVVLPDEIDDRGVERELTAMCFPGQISLGMFRNLIDKKPDYYFIPNHLEMDAEEGKYQRQDFNCTCIFVSGEPYVLKQSFKDLELGGKLIEPIFNFGNGIRPEKDKFLSCVREMGFGDMDAASEAFEDALSKQDDFFDEMRTIGREFLKKLESEPDSFAVVLVGRPYNSFNDFANKGIPRKTASRGIYVIPFEMLDYRGETVDDDMYWEGGKKILKAAKAIKRHPQLFAFYISNFSCAPDSMLVPMFRNIMGTKPSLTLELDSHSADAGINTRIDAAIDIIRNYLKVKSKVKDPDYSDYVPARIEFGKKEAFFISSEGDKVSLSDPRVTIILPSMGDLAAELFAAGMRSQGFNAIAAPPGSSEILKYGRAHATGKECMPLLLCTGSLLQYIDKVWDGKQYLCFFIVQGAGNCRLGYYPSFMKNVIKEQRIKNVTTLELMHEDGFAGLGAKFASRGIETLIASDVLDDIRSGIMAHAKNPGEGLEIFHREFSKLCGVMESRPDDFYKGLKEFAANIKEKAPAARPIENAKYIALLGEMYVRRDQFAYKYLNKRFAKEGFILKDAYISEWIFYVDYLLKEGLYEPLKLFKNKYERLVRYIYMRIAEQRIKSILSKSGYYKFNRTRISPLVEHGKHIVPLEFKGEPLLVLGALMNDALEKYCGVVSIGPFGCMQSRFAEAVCVPEANIDSKLQTKKMNEPGYRMPKVFNGLANIPFLPVETDGNTFPQVIEARLETFTLQAGRVSKLMELSRNGG